MKSYKDARLFWWLNNLQTLTNNILENFVFVILN